MWKEKAFCFNKFHWSLTLRAKWSPAWRYCGKCSLCSKLSATFLLQFLCPSGLEYIQSKTTCKRSKALLMLSNRTKKPKNLHSTCQPGALSRNDDWSVGTWGFGSNDKPRKESKKPILFLKGPIQSCRKYWIRFSSPWFPRARRKAAILRPQSSWCDGGQNQRQCTCGGQRRTPKEGTVRLLFLWVSFTCRQKCWRICGW